MKLQIFQVDAFTNHLFKGNPAAICPLDNWLEDTVMQAIAAENNLSETAFFVQQNDVFQIRWFTPAVGINEDPVTGSAHTKLIPFWAEKLDKESMTARQLSQRGGELRCTYLGDRVEISGQAVTYMTGEIFI